jgi:hypothetical protein
MLTWQQIVRHPVEGLEIRDIAETNLVRAADLPDEPSPAERAQCLSKLDHMAGCLGEFTRRHMADFRARPGHFDNSEGIFRMVCLMAVVQTQFGVRYNPAKIPHDAPFNTADSFIHGALLGEGGTCASLPVNTRRWAAGSAIR